MAHGYLKNMLVADVKVYSAGVKKHGLNVDAVKVMGLDGVDISTTSSFTGSINNSSNPFYVGRSFFSGRYLDGRIARVRFTRGHGLSTTDLLQKFNAEKSSFGL